MDKTTAALTLLQSVSVRHLNPSTVYLIDKACTSLELTQAEIDHVLLVVGWTPAAADDARREATFR